MKISQIGFALSVFLIAAMFSSQAMAQDGGMMRMMRMMGGLQLDSNLLALEEVQKELEMTDEQVEEIGGEAKKLSEKFQSEIRSMFQGGGADQEEMDEMIKEFKQEEKEFVGKLNDDQASRFSQLRFQKMGNQVFEDETAQEMLGITDEQKKNIKEAFQANMEAMQEAMDEARDSGDWGAIRTAREDLGKELTATIDELMTEEQKEKLVEMKGEEFEFPQPQRRSRGGGRSDF